MKKILLSTCAILVALATFAQSKMAELPKELPIKFLANDVPVNYLPSSSVAASAPAPFWFNEFDNSADWTTYDALNGGLQDWVIGTAGPTGSFSSPMGAIASTTTANGFAMFDSDALGTSATNTQDATITYNGTVDCSAYSYVNINFESSHRKFQDSVFVEISNDAWVTFERFEVHASQVSNESSTNPEFISVNISNVAGNQVSVSFRFHYEGQWDYAWMVDDVNFTETPDNLMSINNAVTGGYWIDYQNYLAAGLNTIIGLDYTVTPVDQVAVRPFSCEAVITNSGVSSQSAVLKYDVTGSATYSGSSLATVLASSDVVTVAATPTFSPGIGNYVVEMWAEADSAGAGLVITNSDIETRNIEVSQYLYGKDEGAANQAGSYAVGDDDDENQISTRYEIYANADLYSLRVFIDDGSTVGAKIYAIIYESDSTATDGVFYLDKSDDYTLTAQDLGNWIDVPFLNPISLFAGYAYEFGVGGYQHPIDISLVGSTANTSLYNGEHSSFDVTGLSTQSAGTPTWYYITSTPMIRMNFDPGSSTPQSFDCIGNSCIDQGNGTGQYSSYNSCMSACSPSAVIDEQSNISIYPNPSIGSFTISLEESGEFVVSVINVLSQTVFTDVINSKLTKVNLTGISKGIYTVELNSGDVLYTEKLIIE